MYSILIVEDSKSFGSLLRNRLQATLGCYVVWARSYAEAVKKIEEASKPFFVAILDLHLPDAPKGEIVDFVLAQKIPVVVLTGIYQSELRNRILSQGVLDFFIKDNISVVDSVIRFIERIQKNKKTNTLIVDDSRSARSILRQALMRYEFPVLEASDGTQALEQIKKNDLRLVVTDYEMPGMDGAQLTKKIRTQYSRDEMVVIGLSSKGDQGRRDLAVQFIKAGANDFLSKPFQTEELFWRVSQNLEILERNKKLDNLVKRTRSILDNALDAIITTDTQGRVIDFNPSAEHLFGYARAEIMGQNFINFLIPPALRKKKRAWLRRHAICRGKAPAFKLREELPCLRSDGKIIDIELSLIATHQQEELQFTAFLHDITDRKQLLKSLQETLTVAESSNQLKSNFMANMSHEIRTPMNAVMGFNALALRSDLSPVVRDYLKKADNASHTLMGIIDDILDFSKIEAGKMELDPVTFNLHDVFDRLANLFIQQTTEKGLELILSMPPNFDHTLFGDMRRLEQVLINLIRNAIKFTEKGAIIVQTKLTKQSSDQITATFLVMDTGIGIDPKRLPHLFEPFVQADGSTTRKYGGTGLGLTISKNLVDMMGGKISATSTLGKGSTFSFDLPFEYRSSVQQKPPTLPDHLQGMRVLIVEDSALTRKILRDILSVFFVDIHSVSSGEAALAELQMATHKKIDYRLILMDWRLPGMDGIETSAKVIEHLSSRQPPIDIPKIIMMTAFGKKEIQQQAKNIGVASFVSKPMTRAQLFRAIMEVFGEKVSNTDRPATYLSGTTETTKQISGARILLVEDNIINQEIAHELLVRVGLTVVIANNGKEALEKVQQSAFDAVLMDVQMPEMNGLEATRRIRSDVRFKDLPIIAMTAHVMANEQKECLNAGMNAHLAKPIRTERLYGLLTQWIGPIQQPTDTSETDEVFIPEIPGINITEGLERVAGNRRLYLKFLVRFQNDRANDVETISRALEKGDTETASRVVHTVKGVAGNLGAIPLYHAAKELEKAIKNGDKHAWKQLNETFTTALTLIFDGLKNLKEIDTPPIAPPLAQRISTDTGPLISLLTDLAEKLASFNIDTDSLRADMNERLKGTQAEPAFRTLEKHIENYEFQKALAALDQLTHILEISLGK